MAPALSWPARWPLHALAAGSPQPLEPCSAPRAQARCNPQPKPPAALCCAQAARRGLDVEQLHDSQTPAWRNLRTRDGGSRLKRASYYEGEPDADDEVADQRSDEEEAAESEGEEGSSGSSSEVRAGRGRRGAAGGRGCRVQRERATSEELVSTWGGAG